MDVENMHHELYIYIQNAGLSLIPIFIFCDGKLIMGAIKLYMVISRFRKLNNQKTGVLQSQDNGFTVQRRHLKRAEVVGVLLIHVSCFTAFTKMR